jgi:hypothetical protein
MQRKVGDVVIAPNGYSYTYVEGADGKPTRVLTHWVVAEKKYGRKKAAGERVIFTDGNRANLKPSNIEYASSGNKSTTRKALLRREATLRDRIRELQAELDDVVTELKASSNGKR